MESLATAASQLIDVMQAAPGAPSEDAATLSADPAGGVGTSLRFRSVLEGLPEVGGAPATQPQSDHDLELGDVLAGLFGAAELNALQKRVATWIAGSFAMGLVTGLLLSLAL